MARSVTRTGILWTGLEKVLVYGITFVQGVILARLLGPEDFGLAAMLGIFLGVGGILAESGLGTALVVSPACLAVERRVLRWNLGLAALLYLALAVAAPGIASWYGKPVLMPLMWVMAAGLLVNAASVVSIARLTRGKRFDRLAGLNGAASILGASAAIALAWAECGVWAIAGQGLVTAMVRTALAWCLSRPASGDADASGDSRAAFGRLLGYGAKLMASGLIHTVYTESYNLVIGKLWSPVSVGLFARGGRWARLPGEIANEAVGRVALPELVGALGKGWKFCFINCLLLWPGLVVLYFFATPIVRCVLGGTWLDCVPYLKILLVGQFLTPISGIALQMIRASGRSDVLLRTDAVKKPIGLVALACGIPFGVLGLCWAKVADDAAEALVDVLFVAKLKKTCKENPHD